MALSKCGGVFVRTNSRPSHLLICVINQSLEDPVEDVLGRRVPVRARVDQLERNLVDGAAHRDNAIAQRLFQLAHINIKQLGHSGWGRDGAEVNTLESIE